MTVPFYVLVIVILVIFIVAMLWGLK